MSGFLELLRRHLGPEYALNEWQCRNLEAHFELLWRWNRKINLTGVHDVEEVVVHHYCESIALGSILPMGKLRIMDAGSGAGFPGIPLAIVRPECFVILVESDGRKCVFLREATLALMNCLVVRSRLQHVQETADWLVSRAVRWREIVERVGTMADNVALLVTTGTALEAAADGSLAWSEPVKLPWGERKVVLRGHVSRETRT